MPSGVGEHGYMNDSGFPQHHGKSIAFCNFSSTKSATKPREKAEPFAQNFCGNGVTQACP